MNQAEPPKSIFNQLENGYNDEANHRYMQHVNSKNMYQRIAELEAARNSQRKNIEKTLKEEENKKIKDIWQINNERYLEDKKRRKAEIDQARKINQTMSFETMNSKVKDDFQPYDNYNEFCREQFVKQKHEKEQFFREGQDYHEIRKEKERKEKFIDMRVAHQKQWEQDELSRKRQTELKRIKDKHQQNAQAYYQLDQTLRQKNVEQQMLENIIVNKGANDQQARMIALRAHFEAQEKQRKDSYIRDLKSQVDGDANRQNNHRMSQMLKDRKQIHQRNRYFSMMEQMDKVKKQDEDKKTRQILKGQMKPRVLLQQADKMQKVGFGSPVNIGKVMGDDRKRQLDWIEKSLLREIHY